MVSYFYHNFVDISQSRHRRARVRKSSNKKSSAIKLFQFSHIKTQQRYILQEEAIISKLKLSSSVDSLHDVLKAFDEASKCLRNRLPETNIELPSTKSEDNLFPHYCKDITEHPN